MEKIIFFALVIPILGFVLYLGATAIMKGFSAKSANKTNENIETEKIEDTSNEENKLSEMLKEVGLELEDFSSENSFNQSFSNGEEGKTKNKFKPADTNNSNDINDHENYIKDESLLNIKV